MFKEGQGGVQGACGSGMRWGKKRKQGLDHVKLRQWFIFQKQQGALKVLKAAP